MSRFTGLLFGLICLFLIACGTYTTPTAAKVTNGKRLVGTATASLFGGTFQVADNQGLSCSGNYDALDASENILAPVLCSDGKTGAIRIQRTKDLLSDFGTVSLSDGTQDSVAFGKLATSVFQPVEANREIPEDTSIEGYQLITVDPVIRSSLADTSGTNAIIDGESYINSNNQNFANLAPAGGSLSVTRSPQYGNCDCPYDYKSDGSECGASSAYIRSGGESPICFGNAPVKAKVYAPSCAENGSCYGDVSRFTGRAKTTSMSGYHRENGTYVRGHFRG